jgi:hypothetical protein
MLLTRLPTSEEELTAFILGSAAAKPGKKEFDYLLHIMFIFPPFPSWSIEFLFPFPFRV